MDVDADADSVGVVRIVLGSLPGLPDGSVFVVR